MPVAGLYSLPIRFYAFSQPGDIFVPFIADTMCQLCGRDAIKPPVLDEPGLRRLRAWLYCLSRLCSYNFSLYN